MQGLSEKEAASRLQQYGENTLHINDTKRVIHILVDVIKEPMFIMLIAACSIYFILGEIAEGVLMLVAMCFVAAISLYQEVKSSRAMDALKQLTEPEVKVFRDGKPVLMKIEKLVPGDYISLEEGEKIPADAQVVSFNDLSVNESIVTGESMPVEKNASDILYQGTVLNAGRCIAAVTATGEETVLGKIGKSIITYAPAKTLLQQQVGKFVSRLAIFGIIAFFLILIFNYYKTHDVVASLLFGLTLAMSAIPEEIPVAFSSFMALGAFHMSKLGIITRQPQVIENLGAVNVICIDKTGTITENKMKVAIVYDDVSGETFFGEKLDQLKSETLFYATLASERSPFDAMEKAIWEAYQAGLNSTDLNQFKLVKEYPLEGRPPMMTHVYEKDGKIIAAAKGAVERIINACRLPAEKKDEILGLTLSFGKKGYRLLGVASAIASKEGFPEKQDDFDWKFQGLLSLYDAPRANVKEVFQQFYAAGIEVKLLTGDFSETAIAIANETGVIYNGQFFTGEQIMQLKDEELGTKVRPVKLFSRMFPEAKLRVVDALKRSGKIVAMTGDGVNDAPALKSADIGIAMGQKGTDIARQSADLIITDDNLHRLVDAIAHGRKIFNNLQKAVRYIVSIHIPIILTASLPLLFGWRYPNIFTPVHVIFLELIMGPTCSIFFEREPVEAYLMKVPPRKREIGLLKTDEFILAIFQGLMIAGGVLSLYYFYMRNGASLEETRTVVFIALIISNIFLTFVNRSFVDTIDKTIRYKNNLALPVLVASIIFICVLLFVPMVSQLFLLTSLQLTDLIACIIVAFVSVGWFELYKYLQVKLHKNRRPIAVASEKVTENVTTVRLSSREKTD